MHHYMCHCDYSTTWSFQVAILNLEANQRGEVDTAPTEQIDLYVSSAMTDFDDDVFRYHYLTRPFETYLDLLFRLIHG